MSAVSILVSVVAVLVLFNAGLIFFLLTRKGAEKSDNGGALSLIQQQIHELSKMLDAKVSESSRTMQENAHRQFSESSKLIKEITQEVTSVKEIGRQTQGFAEQLKSLQDILKNPKQRGVLGEYYLETVLKNVLPPGMYQTQYPFKNGEIVDAAVFVNEKIVPIDSKFSLENYNRLVNAAPEEKPALEKMFVNDLKLRITETAKYIRPEENTMDFAFMFIPSESLYYDLLIGDVGTGSSARDLIEYAFRDKKVIIVSPTSFMAYLQTVLQGLRSLQIEEQAKDIQIRVGKLGQHIAKFDSFMQKLGAALGTTVNHYNAAHKELGKVDKDVVKIAGTSSTVEPLLIDKPKFDE